MYEDRSDRDPMGSSIGGRGSMVRRIYGKGVFEFEVK